jgi:aconitate hydratase 2/2-methylisocitrate dehydratase
MSLYSEYIKEIQNRKEELGLAPKPIDSADLLSEIIAQIKEQGNQYREDSLNFFIYNTLPGTTSAAGVKARFLKEIILGQETVAEISSEFAFELLSHMKGGPSIEVLLDLALSDNVSVSAPAATVLKTQVFLYDADTARLETAFKAGNAVAKDILESYAQAEFFTKLPAIEEKIDVVTYIAGEGDISTDLLSPGHQAHSRADRELHGQCMITPEAQKEIKALQAKHPKAKVMLIAEKGTMGVGSSRMSGVNNVALWAGQKASPYVPFINIAPVVAGTNGIAPIFLTTVDVTGGIGLDLKNWVNKVDADGNNVKDANGDAVLEEAYSVATGTVLTIDTNTKKLYNGDTELVDVSSAFTPQKQEFMKAGGSYAVVFGKKLQTFAAETLGVEAPVVYAPAKEISHDGQGLTAVEKIFNRNAVGVASQSALHAGSNVRVKVNIVGSQDTTGPMTCQE